MSLRMTPCLTMKVEYEDAVRKLISVKVRTSTGAYKKYFGSCQDVKDLKVMKDAKLLVSCLQA